MSFEDRVRLMKEIGKGGSCLIDGGRHKLVRFDEVARLYEFTDPRGRWWGTGDEAFEKGLHDISRDHES